MHCLYGFPKALFDVQYPVSGDPDLAREITELVRPQWVGLDHDQWGNDHGIWSVPAHMYPDADIPVLQLSINALKPLDYHLELAAAENSKPEPLVRGYSMGSISMTCFSLGAEMELRKDPTCGARLPEGMPPDQTNM